MKLALRFDMEKLEKLRFLKRLLEFFNRSFRTFFLEYDESNRAEVAVDCGQSHKSRYQIKKAIAKNNSVTSKQVPVTYASSLPPISIKGLYLNITKNYLKMPRY